MRGCGPGPWHLYALYANKPLTMQPCSAKNKTLGCFYCRTQDKASLWQHVFTMSLGSLESMTTALRITSSRRRPRRNAKIFLVYFECLSDRPSRVEKNDNETTLRPNTSARAKPKGPKFPPDAANPRVRGCMKKVTSQIRGIFCGVL